MARCSASVEAGLAFEADAAFGDLGFGRVRFHPVDLDIRGAVGANVPWPTHLKFTLAPAALDEKMAAGLPDFEPLQVRKLPRDASLLGFGASTITSRSTIWSAALTNRTGEARRGDPIGQSRHASLAAGVAVEATSILPPRT